MSYSELADVSDVRRYLQSLGDTPVETYYARAQEVRQKINKKASAFGVFTNDKKKKDSS